MANSKEEQQQEEARRQQAIREQQQAQAQQAQAARNTQVNAGGVPPAVDPNLNNPLQTVANVSPAQAQADAQAQATVQQNIEGDAEALKYNEDLSLLKRIVGKASPIIEDVKETESSTDAEGNPVEIPTFKKVTKGYTYYAVDGQPFEEWVQQTFNGRIEVDTENNKIIYNEPIETQADKSKDLLRRQQEGQAKLDEARKQEKQQNQQNQQANTK